MADAYYVAGSYMVTETFGKDYAVFLQYLAPDYGRVILDLENSGTGNVIYHSSMRYAGCTRGIYRESNVLVMNSLLNGEWGKVERPIAKGFPFNSSEEISITVTATETAYKFSVQSGISTFTYHYTYRYGTDPENVDRINSYIIEYRECPPLKKGEVLDYGFGKQISDFRVGTVIAIHGIAPPNLGQIVSVRIVQKVSVSEKNKDPIIVNVSVKEINPGEKFSITIRIREDSIHLSVNGGSFHMHTFEKGRKIDDISQSATIWISGIYHLIRIDAI